jgi:hypothetical protein
MALTLPAVWQLDDVETHEQELSINEGFAHVLKLLVAGEMGPEQAVVQWAALCYEHAQNSRALSHSVGYSTAEQQEDESRELYDEANTWLLLKHMFSRHASPCSLRDRAYETR